MEIKNGITVSGMIEKCPLVALVEVTSVSNQGKSVEARKIEIYKGTAPEVISMSVPSMWCAYDFDWFKKGEKSVIFALIGGEYCPGKYIPFSIAGRMPLITQNGHTVAVSYVDDASYLEEVRPAYQEHTCTVDWDSFRLFLFEKGGGQKNVPSINATA